MSDTGTSGDIVIVSTARTPIGKFGGALAGSNAVDIGGQSIAAAIERSGMSPEAFDEAIVGQARQAGSGPNPGRLMAIGGGLPASVPAHTVQQACLSSMKAIILAGQAIRLGEAETVLAGGSEHMSGIPYYLMNMRWGLKSGDSVAVDGLFRDGFTDPLTGHLMGELAEAWRGRFGIDRDAQDAFALQSQQGVKRALESGFTERVIVPVQVPDRRNQPVTVDQDEHPRPDTTLEGLAKLRPAYTPDGAITAGNASGVTDGAVALVVMSDDSARAAGIEPLAYVRSWAVVAVEPQDYGLAVVPASRMALDRAGLTFDDMDHVEINEAYAVMVLAACQRMDLDPARVNPYGGAIALGHPVGASGARVIQYAVEGLAHDGGRYALASICGNGGHGAAVVLERA
ncbi:MAG: thiolase family protein [Acidimicrobiia bacterium]